MGLWGRLDQASRSWAGNARQWLSSSWHAAAVLAVLIGGSIVARYHAHAREFGENPYRCDAFSPCGCSGWSEAWHFARRPLFSEAHWIVCAFVLVPVLLVFWPGLERRTVAAAARLRDLGVVPPREDGSRHGSVRSPALPAMLISIVVVGLDVHDYAAFRRAPGPLDPDVWFHGASWAQVAFVYALEGILLWWMIDGFFVVLHVLLELRRDGLRLRPLDPLERLGLGPLAGVFDAMMAASLVACLSAFASRLRSSGTVRQFVTEASKPSIETVFDGNWKIRWPGALEMPAVALALSALLATLWFPVVVLTTQRRHEVDRRVLELARLQDASGLRGAEGAKSTETDRIKRLEEEIARLRRATIWPNGERASALLSLSIILALGGAVPALLFPLVGLGAVLGLAGRLTSTVQLGLSGRSSEK